MSHRRSWFGAAILLLVVGRAEASTYTIKPDGSGSFPTLAAAVAAAVAGDVIQLVNGIYPAEGFHEISLQGKAISIRALSGNPALCILQGDGPHIALYLQNNEGNGTLIYGITFRGHFVALSGFNSSPRIQNCVFEDTGLFGVEWSGGGPRILGCTFRNNLCGLTSTGNPIVESCTFVDNINPGWPNPGAALNITGGTYQNCLFRNNRAVEGGAVSIELSSAATFNFCTFQGNVAERGGAIHGGSAGSPSFTNCTFYGNDADEGGILYTTDQSRPNFVRCILAGSPSGGAVACAPGGADHVPTFNCTDIHGNVGGDWTGCIAGLDAQNGNIGLDPLFCDSANGNFGLNSNSPCRPFSPPNEQCDQIGAYGVACGSAAVPDGEAGRGRVQISPNPGIGPFEIRWSAPETGATRVFIFDAAGRRVRAFRLEPGVQSIAWDRSDDARRRLPSGVYLCRVQHGGSVLERTVVALD